MAIYLTGHGILRPWRAILIFQTLRWPTEPMS